MDKTERALRGASVESAPQTSPRRIGYVERTLTGRGGAVPAVVGWLVVALVVVTFVLFGLFLMMAALIMVVVVLVIFTRAGVHTRFSYWLMVTSLGLGALCAAFAWLSWGVAFDAGDKFQEPPAFTDWMGAALLLMLVCGAGFIASVVLALRRERAIEAQR